MICKLRQVATLKRNAEGRAAAWVVEHETERPRERVSRRGRSRLFVNSVRQVGGVDALEEAERQQKPRREQNTTVPPTMVV